MMNNLAIIPARGGSIRIQGKNIKPFLGKPVIAYSIEMARGSGLFGEVMVSTDHNGIAEIARQYGAAVPFMRSENTSGDYAILNDVLLEVLTEYKKSGIEFGAVCMLLPAAPLIRKEWLQKGYDMLQNEKFDSVRPVIKFSYPIQRSLRMTGNRVEMFFPEHYASRSQDLEPAYHDAGQFYWIAAGKSLTDPDKGAFIIPESEAHDIDTPEDWGIAEMKYKLMHKTG